MRRRARSRAEDRRAGGRSRAPTRARRRCRTTPRAAASSTNSVVASSIESGSSGRTCSVERRSGMRLVASTCEVRRAVEELGDVHRCAARGARGCRGRGAAPVPFERVRDRREQRRGRPTRGRRLRARSRSARARARRHGSKPDEVHGPLHRGAGRDLERESALACSARPRDRHEADVPSRRAATSTRASASARPTSRW